MLKSYKSTDQNQPNLSFLNNPDITKQSSKSPQIIR